MDNKEFTDFYNKNIEKIYRFIFLKVDSQETAQDLTSEAFLKFLNYAARGEKIENPRAFLYRVARNLIIDSYREKSKSVLPLEEAITVADSRQNPDVGVILTSDMESVKKALANLNDEYADIITWHYLNDLSTKEIGQILERPEGTVRVMLHRGLKELKKLLIIDY